MSDELIRYLVRRITFEYAVLWKDGLAPPLRACTDLFPEGADALLRSLRAEEDRLRKKHGLPPQTEDAPKSAPEGNAETIAVSGLADKTQKVAGQDVVGTPPVQTIQAAQTKADRVAPGTDKTLVFDGGPTVRTPEALPLEEAVEEELDLGSTRTIVFDSGTTLQAKSEADDGGTVVFDSTQTLKPKTEADRSGTTVSDGKPITQAEDSSTVVFDSGTTLEVKPETNDSGTVVFDGGTTLEVKPKTDDSGTVVFDGAQTMAAKPETDDGGTIVFDSRPTVGALPEAEVGGTMVFGNAPTVGPQTPSANEPDTPKPAPEKAPEKSSKKPLPAKREYEIRDALRLEEYLGRGAWKDVYKARQESTRQYVALKHLREKNSEVLDSLTREVRTQAQLTHQNIPPVMAMNVFENGQAIVVEKLVDGSPWTDTITTRSLEDNLRVLLEVAHAVSFAHRKHRIIHRDLKPDNVAINDEFGEVYVLDWGLAADVSDPPREEDDLVPHVSRLTGIGGTPLYWAPEMASGHSNRCSPASDVFLLGGLLYEILTHHAPFALCKEPTVNQAESTFLEVGPTLRAIRGIVCPPKERAPEHYIPDELEAIVMKALAPDPAERYADAGFFADALKLYQRHAEATFRCEEAWDEFEDCRQLLQSPDEGARSLQRSTLRLIELADTFLRVSEDLSEDIEEEASMSTIYKAPPPSLISAWKGELESRQSLFDVTLETGDLSLAKAQIELMERNPLHREDDLVLRRLGVRKLEQARGRARMMKWVAASLLLAFLGSSVLYGYLINRQFRQTEIQRQLAESNYRRAEANFQSAREVVNSFLTDFAKDDSLKNLGLMPIQRKLLDSAKEYYDLFSAQKSDDPQVLFEQMHALFDIAGLETRFGNYQDVPSYYQRAIALGERLAEEHPDTPEYRDLLAKCYRDLGVFHQMIESDPEIILELYRKGLALNRALAERYPDEGEYQRNLSRILHNLGETLQRRLVEAQAPQPDLFSQAEMYYRDSLKVREKLRETDPPEYLYGTAQTLLALGVLYLDQAKIEQKAQRELLWREHQQSGKKISRNVEAEIVEASKKYESVLNRCEAAKSELSRARSLIEQLRGDHPSEYGIMKEFLDGQIRLKQGELVFFEERYGPAEEHLLAALKMFDDIVSKAPEEISYQGRLEETFELLYDTYTYLDNNEEQVQLCLRRITMLQGMQDRFKDVMDYLCFWADWKCNLADTLKVMEHFEEAAGLLEKAISEFQERMPAPMPLETDRQRKAARAVEKSLDDLRQLQGLLQFDLLAESDPPDFPKQYEIASGRMKELGDTVRTNPENDKARLQYVQWCQNTAISAVYLQKPEEAVKLLQDTIKDIEALPPDHVNGELLKLSGEMEGMIRTIQETMKRLDE